MPTLAEEALGVEGCGWTVGQQPGVHLDASHEGDHGVPDAPGPLVPDALYGVQAAPLGLELNEHGRASREQNQPVGQSGLDGCQLDRDAAEPPDTMDELAFQGGLPGYGLAR